MHIYDIYHEYNKFNTNNINWYYATLMSLAKFSVYVQQKFYDKQQLIWLWLFLNKLQWKFPEQ